MFKKKSNCFKNFKIFKKLIFLVQEDTKCNLLGMICLRMEREIKFNRAIKKPNLTYDEAIERPCYEQLRISHSEASVL